MCKHPCCNTAPKCAIKDCWRTPRAYPPTYEHAIGRVKVPFIVCDFHNGYVEAVAGR